MNSGQPKALVKLTGSIANYEATRSTASFVFDDSDRNAMGVVAIAAAIAGLGGSAISTAANATATEEDADYLEFDLDDHRIRGWVWRSPFKEGAKVEVVAEWREDHYELAGIARPSDRIIALYPHCSRGRTRHFRNASKWWLVGSTLVSTLALAISVFAVRLSLTKLMEGFPYMALGFYTFFGVMTFSLSRRWMPFVGLAERVFTTLGWPNPGSVDLVETSKAKRKPDDPGELGTFYFRY